MSKLPKDIKFLNKKRNLKKETINYNLYNEKIFKKNLKTYQELKEEAQTISNYAKNIKDMENCIKIYDVNEEINLKYLKTLVEIDNKKGFDEFIKYKYTLNYEERINFMDIFKENLSNVQKDYSDKFVFCQKDRLEKVFLALLKFLIEEEKIDLSKLFGKFCKEFYIETLEYKIPIIYGNDELFFAHLINSFYNYFIINKLYPIFSLNINLDLNNIKIKKRKSSMVIKSKIKEEQSNKFKETLKENDYLTDIGDNFSDDENQKFIYKLFIMKPLIKKYMSVDFQNDFADMLKLFPDEIRKKKIKYKFLSFFELFQYLIIKLDKSLEDSELMNLNTFFYEEKAKKLESLKDMKQYLNVNFYYANENPIDLNKFEIKNIDYLIEINNTKFNINFNNFVIKWLLNDMIAINEAKYEKCLNNLKNFSLQGFIINNRCFNDENIFDLFLKDLDETLNNSTLKETFDCIIPFQNYNYPYLRKKFREQLKEIMIYIPFINNNILGITLRNLGLVVINKNVFKLDDSNNIYKAFSTSLLNSCFGKITILHESNFHYILKIISSQNEEITCKTPYKYFKNYQFKKNEVKNYGGDFGEALLFGEKVYQIFWPAAEKIFGVNYWKKNNIDFEKLGTDFILLNKKNNKYDYDLTNLSAFTKEFFNFIESELKKYKNQIDYTQMNLGENFVRMRKNDGARDSFKNPNLGEISVTKIRNIPDVID